MAKAKDEAPRGAGRWLVFALSIVVGLPLAVLFGLTLAGPPSIEAGIFCLAGLLFTFGGLAAPWRREGVFALRAAIFIALAVVGFRFLTASHGRTIVATTGPYGTDGRWVDRIVPERDIALGATHLLLLADALPRGEAGLLDSLRDGYHRMAVAEGAVPSPVLSTFLLSQSSQDHSLLRIAPRSRFNPPEAAVVFLHGSMGNVTVECWQVSLAAIPVGMDVICPSATWRAAWAEREGRATVELTIAQLRAEGVQRIYLAGLSAGAIGASRIARAMDIEGLILISGASRQANPARIPTLVIQGDLDRMTPPPPARRYARGAGRHARYVEVEGAGHWMILSHHEYVTNEIRAWLSEQEGSDAIHAD